MKAISLDDRRKITERYLRGDNKKHIAADYGISKKKIETLLDNKFTNTEIEKTMLELPVVRENNRILYIKDQILNYIQEAIEEGLESNNKLTLIDKVSKALDQIDRIARLNSNKATGIEEKRNITANISEIMKELPTAEDKKAFLLKQLHNKE